MKNSTPLNEQACLAQAITNYLGQGKTLCEIAHELNKSVFECEWLIDNIHTIEPVV